MRLGFVMVFKNIHVSQLVATDPVKGKVADLHTEMIEVCKLNAREEPDYCDLYCINSSKLITTKSGSGRHFKQCQGCVRRIA